VQFAVLRGGAFASRKMDSDMSSWFLFFPLADFLKQSRDPKFKRQFLKSAPTLTKREKNGDISKTILILYEYFFGHLFTVVHSCSSCFAGNGHFFQHFGLRLISLVIHPQVDFGH